MIRIIYTCGVGSITMDGPGVMYKSLTDAQHNPLKRKHEQGLDPYKRLAVLPGDMTYTHLYYISVVGL